MAELSKSDAELAFRYLNDRVRADVEHEAHEATRSLWESERPDDLAELNAAANGSASAFGWDIMFETSPDHDGDLVPLAGVEPGEESDVYDLAHDFGWELLDNIRDEVRALQTSTIYSPREFVALVLDAAENTPEEVAHREMDISLGNYRGKKGSVADKLEAAEETVRVTERLRE